MIKLARLLGSALPLLNPTPARSAPLGTPLQPSAPSAVPHAGEGANATPKPIDPKRREQGLQRQVIAALRTIYDPELPVNIYDLGLVYALDVDADGRVAIRMTLTAPGCPVAQTFPAQVERTVAEVKGVTSAHVEIVWDPPWDQSRMSEAARLQLGLV
jgi:FeS assembly SUF system protein